MPVCPRCGDPVPEPVDDRGRCLSCFLEAVDLVEVPETVAVDQCVHCGSVAIDGDWRDDHDGAVALAVEALADRIGIHRDVDAVEWSVRDEPVDDRHVRVRTHFDLEVAGRVVRREGESVVAIERTVCPRCSRIHGDDYGAIVQLRAGGRRPTDREDRRARDAVARVLDDRVDRGDREAYLTDVVARDEGIDFRLSTPRLGDQVATAIRADLGGQVDTARTLVTTDGDGREVYRVTFSVRLPRFRPGDVVGLAEGAGLVESANDALTVRDLRTGERTTASPTAVEGPVTSVAEADRAVVVAPLDDRAVQVVHPTTNEAVTVARYPGVDIEGETVGVVEVDGELYLLPSDAA